MAAAIARPPLGQRTDRQGEPAVEVCVGPRRQVDTTLPYSDQDIVKLLSDRGLGVARRTVAKYREQLGILPSHLRKAF